jgi:hypothetical protein
MGEATLADLLRRVVGDGRALDSAAARILADDFLAACGDDRAALVRELTQASMPAAEALARPMPPDGIEVAAGSGWRIYAATAVYALAEPASRFFRPRWRGLSSAWQPSQAVAFRRNGPLPADCFRPGRPTLGDLFDADCFEHCRLTLLGALFDYGPWAPPAGLWACRRCYARFDSRLFGEPMELDEQHWGVCAACRVVELAAA